MYGLSQFRSLPENMAPREPSPPRANAEFDMVGIGIGPANLSLAALLAPQRRPTRLFLDTKPEFSWHSGLMVSGASTQVHFLKDLVSLVDPTSRFSFIAFLGAKRRLYRTVVAERARAPRAEFEEYYRWVAEALQGDLVFGEEVQAVDWVGDRFVALTADRVIQARNVVLGVGTKPVVPACAAALVGPEVFHASEYLAHADDLANRRVMVIGGGQSAAEVVQDLLGTPLRRPGRLDWVTRRANFLPLDESPFTNELFLPNHSRAFQRFPRERRVRALAAQKLASDGISEELLLALYRRIYEIHCTEGEPQSVRLGMGQEMTALSRKGNAIEVALREVESGICTRELADRVVLATGYRQAGSELLDPLRSRIAHEDGETVVRSDFSLEWDGPAQNRIYVQNAARHRFGIADPNLGLVPWRSATIANSLAGKSIYDTGDVSSALTWSGPLGEPDDATSTAHAWMETWA